jgi:Uma2 family endonuclease
MAMPSLVPKYTIDDLERFPDDGNRYELVDGFLLVTPAPLLPHEQLCSVLATELILQLGRNAPARVYTRGAVAVAPSNYAEPDVMVVPVTAKVPAKWTGLREWWLVVEVSGRGSRVYDRDFKGPAYMRAGVLAYWRVDMLDRCIYVSTPGGKSEERHETDLRWQPPIANATPVVISVPALFDGITGDD